MNLGTIIRTFGAVCMFGILLTGCETPPPPRPIYPDITFAHRPPIRLDVARIEVMNEYVPPLKAPNVEHAFPVSIAAGAERWARDRLQAVGSDGVARLVIKDASATETDLRRTPGVRGIFTTDQAERYDARVEVMIEVRAGNRTGFASAAAQRSRSVPENATLNDRDRVQFELTDALLKDLDRELERNIYQFLPMFLR